MKPEEQAYLDMELERRMQEVRDYVDDALTPFRNLTGVNGLKVTFSDSNVMIDADELQAGDGYGGNALAPIVGIDNGTGGTPDPNDPGEEFTPGDANTPGAAVTYEARERSAVASLVGFAEYTSPSTPAKKYRVKTLSGSLAAFASASATCAFSAATGGPLTVTGGTASYNVSGNQFTISYSFSGTQNGTHFTAVGIDSGEFYDDGVGMNLQGSNPFTMTAGVTYTLRLRRFTGFPAVTENVSVAYTHTGTGSTNESLVYSGTSSYDVATGALTDAGAVSGTLINTSTGALAAVSAAVTSVDDAASRLGSTNFTTATDSATRHALNRSTTCEQIGVTAYYRRVTTCSLSDTLSAEDTDIDAITRWRASPPAYSAWATATFPAASADYDARTTGFTFDFEEAEFRATYTGLPAGWPFKVKVRITKVTQATGAVSTVSNLVFTVVTNGSGGATISVSVIPLGSNADGAIVYEGGYTYRVQSIAHYL